MLGQQGFKLHVSRYLSVFKQNIPKDALHIIWMAGRMIYNPSSLFLQAEVNINTQVFMPTVQRWEIAGVWIGYPVQ